MLLNHKPKNIMTHNFQFYYILIYITYNCLYLHDFNFFSYQNILYQIYIFNIYYMRRLLGSLPKDLQNFRKLTKSQKTLRGYIRKNKLWFFCLVIID